MGSEEREAKSAHEYPAYIKYYYFYGHRLVYTEMFWLLGVEHSSAWLGLLNTSSFRKH